MNNLNFEFSLRRDGLAVKAEDLEEEPGFVPEPTHNCL